jgi:hypothetical protein
MAPADRINGLKVVSTSQVMIMEELGEDETMHFMSTATLRTEENELPPQA